MLTLLLGRDWTANQKEILDCIARDVKQKKPGIILMVPELISHDTERKLCAAAGDTASRYAQVLSFTRFARRICDIAGNVECLDNGGRLVTMAAAARNLHSKLKAYAAVETKPEFLTEVVDAVDEFKRCCITPADLKAASENAQGSLAQKLEELSLLLESYDSLCAQGKRDPRDQMTWVLEQLEEMDFSQCHTFYVDGFPDFTRQHMAVLAHLICNSPQVVVSLNCDRVASGELVFEKAGKTAKELLDLARKYGVETQIRYISGRDDGLKPVRSGLFQGDCAANDGLQDRLQLVQADSVYAECRQAAKRILDLVHDGCRYRDISLVCADMASYRPALQLVLGRSGIPLYIAGPEDILCSGVVSTLLSALDAALGGFEQKPVLRYLRSTLSPLDAEICDRIENYAYIWRIDRKSWKEEWTFHPQGLSGHWDDESKTLLQELNTARQLAIDPLVQLQQAFAGARTLDAQVSACYDFFTSSEFPKRIEALADMMDASGDNRSAQILHQLWEILLNAFEQLRGALGATYWDTDVFSKLLKLLLSQYDVGTIPTVLDAVFAGPVSAQRCQSTKHLLVLGANEGSLPGYGGSAGLLTDQERVELRALGLPLTGGSVDGLQAEFAEIYGVFCGARESVWVSCSAQPSFVFRRLEKMAGGSTFAVPDLADTAVDPVTAGAYLSRWREASAAEYLGVTDTYLEMLYRMSYTLGTVSRENVEALYGKKLNLSASQVDKQAVCRLSYFLQYGLRARERKEAAVDPAEFGTFVHAVLEATVADVMQMGGFWQVDLEKTLEIARGHSDAYSTEHFSQLDSQRLQYLFRRNIRELEMVVEELWRELHNAQFAPEQWELQFGFDGQMPPIAISGSTMQAQLRGLVDRVDVWNRGTSSYFRVVDYKTGKKDFDYCDIYNGVGLQMLLYLFALEEKGKIPAGVQYFPARAPYISADADMTEEEAQKEHLKQWKRQGLLLADEEVLRAMDPSEKMDTLCASKRKDGSLSGDLADRAQLGLLKKYVLFRLGKMVDEIASGKVDANPYSRGTSFDACTFCPYSAVCHKEEVTEKRNYKTVTAQKFWEDIEKEVGEYG